MSRLNLRRSLTSALELSVPRPNARRHLLAFAISAALVAPAAQACGPDFQLRLLSDRAQSLAELPEGNFKFEAGRLALEVPPLKPAAENDFSSRWDAEQNRYLEDSEVAEPQGLTPEQMAKVKELRQLTDAAAVEQAGAELPAELRLYTAGAVAFAQGDDASAQAYFHKVLALPAAERQLRATWAAYSLGRSLARGVDAARDGELSQDELNQAQQADIQAAKQAFRMTRQLALDGASDPLELGIASLGEEARLELDADNWPGAIALYASQLQLGSTTGFSSLKQLAVELAQMPEEQLAPLLKQLPVQQLLTAYLVSHSGWDYEGQPAGEKKLVQLLQRGDIANVANADRLAAVSYQSGDYAATQILLEHAPQNGLTWWLRAKLALQAGDKTAAQAAYAKAAQAFPENENWGYRRDANWNQETVQPHCRVEGESAILALERGDYLQAFEALYGSGYIYWPDAAEVAERVLTLDELKTYVDRHVPPVAPTVQADDGSYQPRPIAAQLRQLLGRRLLREGHYREAPAYFDYPELQAAALAYGQAREQGESRWTATGRAEALYQAGQIARKQGMELLGYEMSPDYYQLGGGMYSLERVTTVQAGGLLSADEAERQNANLAQPNNRYHYRWLAADLASQAAEQLPHTSQAYAATLCRATGWILFSDYPLARQYYQRYVDNGPIVPFSGNFGQNCEEPDFEHVSQRLWQYRFDTARKTLRPYKGWLFGLALVGGILAAGYWRKRRRITVSPTEQ